MHYILRFGEISLKGGNRKFFESTLRNNIVGMFPGVKLRKEGGRFYAESDEQVDFRTVFGIVSYSPAEQVSLDYEEIEGKVLEVVGEGSFAIDSRRLNKQYSYTSMELNRKLGQAVVDKYGLEVNLGNPGQRIGVEVSHKHAYVYRKVVGCFGGLPVGCEGTVAALIEGRASLLAALLMLKRGCDVIPFGEGDVSLLKRFGCMHDVQDGPSGNVVVAGDTLKTFKEYDFDVVLRPLIGYTDEQIEKELERYESVD